MHHLPACFGVAHACFPVCLSICFKHACCRGSGWPLTVQVPGAPAMLFRADIFDFCKPYSLPEMLLTLLYFIGSTLAGFLGVAALDPLNYLGFYKVGLSLRIHPPQPLPQSPPSPPPTPWPLSWPIRQLLPLKAPLLLAAFFA